MLCLGRVRNDFFSPFCGFRKDCLSFALPTGITWDTITSKSTMSVVVWNKNRNTGALFAVGASALKKPAIPPAANLPEASCQQFACSRWVGANGNLYSENGVSGIVTIHASCTFQLENFSFNSSAVEVAYIRSVDGGSSVDGGVNIAIITRSSSYINGSLYFIFIFLFNLLLLFLM